MPTLYMGCVSFWIPFKMHIIIAYNIYAIVCMRCIGAACLSSCAYCLLSIADAIRTFIMPSLLHSPTPFNPLPKP